MTVTRLTLIVLVCACAVLGQEAQLSGLVQDPSALSVVGADISLRNEQTGGRRVTQSNESGLYSFPSLSPGTYRMTIHAASFATVLREGIRLEVGDNARLDFTLRLGDTRTIVTVKGGTPLMNTEDATVGTVIDRNIIERMPLNGRGLQVLIELSPGVTVVPVTPDSPGQFAVNGQRQNANYFMVDGVSANFAAPSVSTVGNFYFAVDGEYYGVNSGHLGAGNLPALNPLGTFSNLVSPEALQEFRIQTSTFAPEFGRTPGTQIGLVTRSGTNRYSGSLFEYGRNEATDANDWFNNAGGLAKPAFRFHDFGGSLGGPVQVPHLYQGHDRTFFFFSFEGTQLTQPSSVALQVPTIQTRQTAPGFLTPFLNALPLPNGVTPISAPYFEPPTLRPGWDWFTGNPPSRYRQRTYGLRVDHYVSDKLTAFARYNRAPSEVSVRAFGNPANTQQFAISTETLTLGLTHMAGANFVNELRGNASLQTVRETADMDGYGGAQRPPESLLFPPGHSAQDNSTSIYFADQGLYFGLWSRNRARQWQGTDTLSYTRGTHRFKAGVDDRLYSPVDSPPGGLGLLYLPGGNYSEPAWSLAGTEHFYGNTIYHIPNFSAYAQDTWRPSRRWTVTYGLRWDVNPAPRLARGQVYPFAHLTSWEDLSHLSFAQLTDLHDISGFSHLSTLAPGQPLYSTQYSQVAPRLGWAWQIRDGATRKTVLRAGAGVFYDTAQNGFNSTSREEYSTNCYSHVPLGVFPTGASSCGFSPPPFRLVMTPGYTAPRIYQWNVTVEQAFGPQTISVGYVGALGRHLVGSTDSVQFNILQFQTFQITGSEFSSAYHSLQWQFNRRLAGRVQALISYTWSHSIDNLSSDLGNASLAAFLTPDLNRGSSDFDIRHSLNGAVLVNLPSPRHGFTGVLLRNWSANSIFLARSAPPTNVSSSAVLSGRRPDLVPGQPLYLYGASYPGGKRINPDAFTDSSDDATQGTLGRNVLRLFGAWQIDLALQRQFSVSERLKLQVRGEAFNLLNHPNFASPRFFSLYPQLESLGYGENNFGLSRTTLGSNLSGSQVLGQLYPAFQIGQARSFQFALRLTF